MVRRGGGREWGESVKPSFYTAYFQSTENKCHRKCPACAVSFPGCLYTRWMGVQSKKPKLMSVIYFRIDDIIECRRWQHRKTQSLSPFTGTSKLQLFTEKLLMRMTRTYQKRPSITKDIKKESQQDG